MPRVGNPVDASEKRHREPATNGHDSPRVSHVISGGTIRLRLASGETHDITATVGETQWSGASPLHDTENIGTTPIRILPVEVKPR